MAWHFARLRGGRRRRRQGGVPAADVRERGAHPARVPAGPVPERRARCRTSSTSGARRRRRIDFLSPDIYFPNFAEWGRRYRAVGQPALRPGGACGAPRRRSTRSTRSAQHDAIGFCPVRHRVDRRAGRDAPRRELRSLGAAHARSWSSTRDAGRWRACCPRAPSSGSPSRSPRAATSCAATFERRHAAVPRRRRSSSRGAPAGRAAAARRRARHRDRARRVPLRRHGRVTITFAAAPGGEQSGS